MNSIPSFYVRAEASIISYDGTRYIEQGEIYPVHTNALSDAIVVGKNGYTQSIGHMTPENTLNGSYIAQLFTRIGD